MSPTFALFVLASFILAITPGPGVIFLVARTLSQGRSIGLASIGGVALGNLGNALLASLGLAVVFAASSTAFLLVKLAGAAYLVLLGAHARGYAGYWRTVPLLEDPRAREILRLSPTETPLALLYLGHPIQEQRVPERAPLSEVVSYLE